MSSSASFFSCVGKVGGKKKKKEPNDRTLSAKMFLTLGRKHFFLHMLYEMSRAIMRSNVFDQLDNSLAFTYAEEWKCYPEYLKGIY